MDIKRIDWNDRNQVLLWVEKDLFALNYANDIFKNDKSIVLQAVKYNRLPLKFASDEIKSLVGRGDPIEILTKAIASEKLSAKLNEQLKPKIESREPMKIKI